MISEWSCDTEDWSNDAENPAFNYILKYNRKVTLNCDISPYDFLLYFWLSAALVGFMAFQKQKILD